MNDILQIVYYIGIILITFPVGFSVVLLSKSEQENWIPKSFLYGTAILLVCSYWLSSFCDKGLRASGKYFVVLLLLGTFIVLFLRKRSACQYIKEISQSDVLSLVFSFLLGMLPLLLVIIYGAQYPYCDGYTYVCNADYLMDYGYNVKIVANDTILHPWLSQTLLYQEEHLRIGAQMFLALFSSLFSVNFSLELFMPVIAYGVFVCGMASWGFATKKYAAVSYYKIIAISMVMLNVPIILWNATYGFLPQIFGSAFFLTAIAGILNWGNESKGILWNVFTTAMMFSGCALAYSEMLPFLVLVTASVGIREFIIAKEDRKYLVIFVISCAMAAIAMIITFVPGMIKAILMQLGSIVGWHQDKDFNTYIGYFLSTVPAEYSFHTAPYSMELLCYELLTVLGAVVVIGGFCKVKKRVRYEYLFVSLPYVLMLIYFVICSENPWIGGRGNSWSIYKLMQYYFIAAIPYLAISVSQFLSRMKKPIVVCVGMGFAVLNIFNITSYMEVLSGNMEYYVGVQEDSIQEYYELYETYGQCEQRIALHNVPDKHRQMITYFLKDVELVSDWNVDSYFTKIPMVPKEMLDAGIHLTYNLAASNHIAGLTECDAEITTGEGFYGVESADDNYWNWSRQESKLNVSVYSYNGNAILDFEIFGLEQEKSEKLLIYSSGGQLLKTIEVEPNSVKRVTLEVPRETKELQLQYSGVAKKFEDDNREMAFAIRNYTIREAK